MVEQRIIGNSRVRAMIHADLERVLAWRNHPDVRRYMYTQDEISMDAHQRWFESAQQEPCKHLLIYELDNQPFGFVNFSKSIGSGRADWGFYAAPNAPKGTGRRLGQAALAYAFNNLELHKICGQALAYNERSIQFHKTLGFHQEGTLRDQHYDGESYHHVVCFGLLSHEWQTNL